MKNQDKFGFKRKYAMRYATQKALQKNPNSSHIATMNFVSLIYLVVIVNTAPNFIYVVQIVFEQWVVF